MGKEMAMMPADYVQWLADIKKRVLTARHKAVLAVNAELVSLYWYIGRDILQRQAAQGWGSKVIDRLGRDLREAFPEMKGFSRANLLYMRAFAEAWTDLKLSNKLLDNCRGVIMCFCLTVLRNKKHVCSMCRKR